MSTARATPRRAGASRTLLLLLVGASALTLASSGPAALFACLSTVCFSVCEACAVTCVASGPAYPVCWTTCCLGLASAGSIAACSLAGLGCLADTTTVQRLNTTTGLLEPVCVGAVAPGDVLAALDSTTMAHLLTPVTGLQQVEGDWEFVTLATAGGVEVTLTTDHGVPVIQRGAAGAPPLLVAAGDVRTGDFLIGVDGAPDAVARVTPGRQRSKWSLRTEHGTVLASGALMSTMCAEDVPRNGTAPLFGPAMHEWRAHHQGDVGAAARA